MKLQKKGFLSLVLMGILLVSLSAEVSAFGTHDGMKWMQHSARTLFLSQYFRRVLPSVALAGIVVALFRSKWFSKNNIRQLESVEQVVNDPGQEQGSGGGSRCETKNIISSIIDEPVAKVVNVEEEQDGVRRFVDQVIKYDVGGEQNGVPVEQQIDRMYLASDRIRHGNDGSIEGIACPSFNNVVVQQVAVLHQDTERQIDDKLVPVGGGNASCGYHAIKNLLMLLTQSRGMAQLMVNDTSLARFLFGTEKNGNQGVDFGSWRKNVASERKKQDDDGEWLDEIDIKRLMNEIDFCNVGYLVIENVNAFEIFEE